MSVIARIARLEDGTPVVLRPLTADDRALLHELLERLSPESRRLRFLTPLPRIPAWMLDALAAVDGDRHFAWIALAGGRPVAHAHAVRTGPAEAEVALMVADALQGRGLGRALVSVLRADAACRGIRCLAMDIDPSNTAAVALARSAGADLRPDAGVLSGALAA